MLCRMEDEAAAAERKAAEKAARLAAISQPLIACKGSQPRLTLKHAHSCMHTHMHAYTMPTRQPMLP